MQLNIKRWPHPWVFFLVCFVYLAQVIEPHLLYSGFGSLLPEVPAYRTSLALVGETLSQPGNMILGLMGLLSQCFLHSWPGALVIMVTALGLSELVRRHFKTAGLGNLPMLTSLPVIMIVLIYSRYEHPLLGVLVVCLGLLSAWIHVLRPWRSGWLGSLMMCVTTVVTFWLGGTGALVVFLVMAAIHTANDRKQIIALLAGIALALAIIWGLLQNMAPVGEAPIWTLNMPQSQAVTGGMTACSRGFVMALYGFAPVCLCTLLLGRWAWHKAHRAHATKRKKHKKGRADDQQKGRFSALVAALTILALPFALMGLSLFLVHDRLAKPYVQMHHHSHLRQWDRVLDTAAQLPKGQTSVYVHHAIVRALFHTDRLSLDLLKYPQTQHGLFLTHEARVSALTQLKLHDLYLAMGQVNMAEKQVSELLAADVEYGCIYERLVWTHIIKEQYETARVFVNALRRDPLHRGTARALWRILDHGVPEDQVNHIRQIRAWMPRHTQTVRESVDGMLLQLLEHNPDNKMAFEYLMTLYLLTGQVGRVAELLPETTRFNYPSTPLLYQEAAIVHFVARKEVVDTRRVPITAETLNRYRRFMQLKAAFDKSKRRALLSQLIEEFGSSYFFYYAFRQVGIK